MIDFRYHLVSLASVLIALAIGIVLGAGPLKEGIGDTLNSQVVQLRQEKTDLRTQLDEAQGSLGIRDSFESATLHDVVAARLPGAITLVVSFPDAPSALVRSTEDTLAASGANQTGRIAVTAKWSESAAADVAERDTLARELAAGLTLPDGTQSGGQALDRVLVAILVNHTAPAEPSGTPSTAPTPEQRASIWDSLSGAGLVNGSLPTTTATSVVVVGGPVISSPTPADEGGASRLAALAAAFDQACDGGVLAADLTATTGTPTTSTVAAARSQSSIRRDLSTVDNAGTPMGQASFVIALVEQLGGESGQYGLLADAASAFPRGT